MPRRPTGGSTPWLLLIHAIPPKPEYFRAKVGKRLQRIGAVPLKRSVYVLPSSDAAYEDFQWLAQEIVKEGGDATVCAASMVQGLTDRQVQALFQSAREADYAALAEEARRSGADHTRVKERLGEIVGIDFFGAPGREAAEAAVSSLERRRAKPGVRFPRDEYRSRRWVTRKNIHVDRIASAWLIRRFIDPKASFHFVTLPAPPKAPRDVTFDMAQADFTHIGDRCTFEVLIDAFALREPGLQAIAEIVHDIDVKDGKFARTEAPGVAALIAGLALSERSDPRRIAQGERIFGSLLELYRRKKS